MWVLEWEKAGINGKGKKLKIEREIEKEDKRVKDIDRVEEKGRNKVRRGIK